MPTLLLTWNPKKYLWCEFVDTLDQVPCFWSTYQTHVAPGDRVFLLKQSVQPRGIVASGYVTQNPDHVASDPGDKVESNPCLARFAHWNDAEHPDGSQTYVAVELDVLLHPDEDPLLAEDLPYTWGFPRVVRRSGIHLPDRAADVLEARWKEHLDRLGLTPGPGCVTRHLRLKKATRACPRRRG